MKKTTLLKMVFCMIFCCIFFIACADDNEPGDGESSLAPPESPHRNAYYRMGLPPEGWTSGVAWVNAVHDRRKTGSSSLKVDWVRFYCVVNGKAEMVTGEGSSSGTGIQWMGLYLRNPWFGNGDHHENINIDCSGDVCSFPLSSRLDRVWHFGGSRAVIPAGVSKCYTEARVKPEGNALVQLGGDFWISQTADWCGWRQCNTEAFASDWYDSSNGWVTISAGKY